MAAALRQPIPYADAKPQILKSLSRIEGQVRCVARMVEEGQSCSDMLTQLSAIISATRRVGLLVLEDRIRSCIGDTRQDQDAVVDALAQVIEHFTVQYRLGTSAAAANARPAIGHPSHGHADPV